jgi:hypothetical protein
VFDRRKGVDRGTVRVEDNQSFFTFIHDSAMLVCPVVDTPFQAYWRPVLRLAFIIQVVVLPACDSGTLICCRSVVTVTALASGLIRSRRWPHQIRPALRLGHARCALKSFPAMACSDEGASDGGPRLMRKVEVGRPGLSRCMGPISAKRAPGGRT